MRTKEVVRIAGRDLDGRKDVRYALADIKGVGVMFANAIINVLGIDPNAKLGTLPDNKIEQIEDIIKNPAKYGMPSWLYNRRKDYETGKDMHLVEGDLEMAIREDIKNLRKIKCYRGIRHALGLRVRGQRTRSTGRRGVTVGVIKSREQRAKMQKQQKEK